MEKQTMMIAFSNQKGGVGKSAMAILMASWLHYTKGLNVAVVDCDSPQLTIYGTFCVGKELYGIANIGCPRRALPGSQARRACKGNVRERDDVPPARERPRKRQPPRPLYAEVEVCSFCPRSVRKQV